MVTASYLEHDVSVAGLKLHYQEWGESTAPAILMLHGFGVSGHMFDEFAERMQDRYRLIALDQRGHGDSEWSPDGDYSRQAFVDDVEGFRNALGLDRFILVGHSMGGLNAVSYTAAHPSQVRALVLVDVGPEAAKEGVDNIVRFTRGPDELEFEEFVEMAHRFNQRRTIENIRERMRHRLRQSESGKWTWKFDKRFREQDSSLRVGSELSNDEMWQLYRSIPVPVLLVRGGESDVLTPAIAERAAREMQRARLVTVAGAGHSVPGDNPDEFTAVVAEFLEDVDRGRFEPVVAADPPPLQELVTAQRRASSRRGPGTFQLVLLGAGAIIAVAAAMFVAKKAAAPRRGRAATRPGRPQSQAQAHASPEGLDAARARAALLVHDLSGVAVRNAERARHLVDEVDFERARAGALDVLHALSDQTAHLPVAATRAAQDARNKRPALARGTGRLLLRAAKTSPRLIRGGRKQRKPRGKLAWLR